MTAIDNSSAPHLILASGSNYRAQQLKQLQLTFTREVADINERDWIANSAKDLAIELATAKASFVLNKCPHAVVIGADQTAQLNGQLLHKPGTREKAQQQLSSSSGQIVKFNSAICVMDRERTLTACTPCEVKFKHLSEEEIESYLDREEALDCAGSFKCEGLGIALFDRITSDDPSALIGLSLIKLCQLLREFNIKTL